MASSTAKHGATLNLLTRVTALEKNAMNIIRTNKQEANILELSLDVRENHAHRRIITPPNLGDGLDFFILCIEQRALLCWMGRFLQASM